MPTQLQALKAFADTEQNPDLLSLESLLKRFNLFEAVGAVRHELRHSDFLAFLLDPSRNHGLGAAFLHRFLQAALALDGIDLSRSYVTREWHNVDILIVDDASRLAVIIENKIGTGEHSDQLNRYRKTFQSHFPGYQAFGLYLTPNGDESSSPDYYRAVSYSLVREVIEQTAQDNRPMLDAEVVMALEHYTQMLRRHIVSDSDVAKLCRSIYKQHKQALDLIFEHRPNQQPLIGEYVKALIGRENNTLNPGGSGKGYITFSLHEWQNSPRHGGAPGNNINWLFFFCFKNEPDKLSLELQIGPGGSEDERHKHLKMAQDYHFTGYRTGIKRLYSPISSVLFLSRNDYENSQEQIETLISEKWEAYLRDELPRIVNAVRKEKWLWELP
jgi:hypothetical protein